MGFHCGNKRITKMSDRYRTRAKGKAMIIYETLVFNCLPDIRGITTIDLVHNTTMLTNAAMDLCAL